MLSLFDEGLPEPCPSPFNLAAYVMAEAARRPDKIGLQVLSLSGAGNLSLVTLLVAPGAMVAGKVGGATRTYPSGRLTGPTLAGLALRFSTVSSRSSLPPASVEKDRLSSPSRSASPLVSGPSKTPITALCTHTLRKVLPFPPSLSVASMVMPAGPGWA